MEYSHVLKWRFGIRHGMKEKREDGMKKEILNMK
jgi:hypothetical protein